MIRPTLIDLNRVELNYYRFRFSCYKCNGSCNALFALICVPNETKDTNVPAFSMMTNKNDAKE